MTTNEKINMIKELLIKNLNIRPKQVTHYNDAEFSTFYVSVGETITAVLFPFKTIEKLEIDKMPTYFKNKINLYESIVNTGIRITIEDDIAILPNHPPVFSR